MSYARWGRDSNWYAFWDSPSNELALWHVCSLIPHWSAEELAGVGADWVREHYPYVTDKDVTEALDIIEDFLSDFAAEQAEGGAA